MCMGSGIPSTDKIYQTSIPLPAKAWREMVAPALGLSVPESKGHQTIKLEMPQKFFPPLIGVAFDVIARLVSTLLAL